MNLFQKLLNDKPLRTPLDFGINENVRLVKIDNSVRKRDGEIIKKNTFLTFTQYNSKDEAIASSEFSYFNLDPESEYTLDNFITQIAQLNNLAGLLNDEAEINPVDDYEDEDELMEDLGSKKGCKKLSDATWEQFEAAIADKVGPESPLIRIKVVTDKKGKYLQLPKEQIIADSMEIDSEESILKLQPYEIRNKNNATAAKVEADVKGDAPVDSKTAKKVLKGI